jgi:hypothetical protein
MLRRFLDRELGAVKHNDRLGRPPERFHVLQRPISLRLSYPLARPAPAATSPHLLQFHRLCLCDQCQHWPLCGQCQLFQTYQGLSDPCQPGSLQWLNAVYPQ